MDGGAVPLCGRPTVTAVTWQSIFFDVTVDPGYSLTTWEKVGQYMIVIVLGVAA